MAVLVRDDTMLILEFKAYYSRAFDRVDFDARWLNPIHSILPL